MRLSFETLAPYNALWLIYTAPSYAMGALDTPERIQRRADALVDSSLQAVGNLAVSCLVAST